MDETVSIEREELKNHKPPTRGQVLKRVLNGEFVLSAFVPAFIYYVFNHYNLRLSGVISAGGWSVALLLFYWLKMRRVNIFSAIAAGISAIGLICTVITRSTSYFLLSPVASDVLVGSAFFGSLLFGKPLIQIFAEYTVKDVFPEELKKKPKYKKAWVILTLLWGCASIAQALLRVILYYYDHSPNKVLYYSIGTIYGSISTPLFLIFSVWFPKWYWKRTAN